MRALLLALAACTSATPIPPRAPAPGVPAHWYPAIWREPAILCIRGYKLGYQPSGWRCL